MNHAVKEMFRWSWIEKCGKSWITTAGQKTELFTNRENQVRAGNDNMPDMAN